MTTPKFKVGDKVRLTSDCPAKQIYPEVYKVLNPKWDNHGRVELDALDNHIFEKFLELVEAASPATSPRYMEPVKGTYLEETYWFVPYRYLDPTKIVFSSEGQKTIIKRNANTTIVRLKPDQEEKWRVRGYSFNLEDAVSIYGQKIADAVVKFEQSLEKETNMSSNKKPATLSLMQKQVITFLTDTSSDPSRHIKRLIDRGFFGINNYPQAEKILRAYIEEHGGCQKQQALDYMGFKPKTKKEWVRKEMLVHDLTAAIRKGATIKLGPDNNYDVIHHESSTYRTIYEHVGGGWTMIVWEEVEVEA